MTLGRPHRHLRTCESTNTLARQLAAEGAAHGTVVTAGQQSAGRGRQGRAWVTTPPDTALAYSVIVRARQAAVAVAEAPEPAAKVPLSDSALPPQGQFAPGGTTSAPQPHAPASPRHAPAGSRQEDEISQLLPLAAAVAVCEAVEELAPVEAKVKWPNDIWIEGRKCAGILVEARPQDGWAVIGVGLNLTVAPEDFPAEIRDRVTSVGSGATPAAAREVLNKCLSHWIEQPAEAILAAFRARDALLGQQVEWAGQAGAVAQAGDRGGPSRPKGERGDSVLTGTAQGTDEAGNLIVTDRNGQRHLLAAGEVHLSV